MPRQPDLPCAGCGKLMWSGATSLPEGKATCQPCRRARLGYRVSTGTQAKAPSIVPCTICARPFPQRRPNQRYCTTECRGRRDRRSRARRAVDRKAYGSAHQKRRRELLPLAYGTACPICGELMEKDHPLDLDHSTPLRIDPAPRPGDRIVHAACNRAGKPVYDHGLRGSRTPRPCVVCGATYMPAHGRQQACGRACGAEVHRRNRPWNVAKARPKVLTFTQLRLEVRTCWCGASFIGVAKHCTSGCWAEWNARTAREAYRAKVGLPPTWDRPSKPRKARAS